MKLDDYQRKRDPNQTNEPFGQEPSRGAKTHVGAYVVHQHDATRLHYDLRIEIDGTLASFAVPKGPSLDPEVKHLAVHTEDHPLEYLDFEGIVPEGLYGAGPMIAWDRGTVRYLEAPAEDGEASGKLDLQLSGFKLNGRFALVRLKGDAQADRDGKNWLLFKKKDAFAAAGTDIVRDKPRSVLSGLRVDELAEAPRFAQELLARARDLGARSGSDHGAFEAKPLLPGSLPAEGADWLFEVKLDGVRVLVERRGADVVVDCGGEDVARFYAEVCAAARALPLDRFVIDGDLIALSDGRPNAEALRRRIARMQHESDRHLAMLEIPVVFVATDLLAAGELDLRRLELRHRKESLASLLRGPGVMRLAEVIQRDPAALLAFCKAHALEGIVAKRASSPYGLQHPNEEAWVLVRAEGAEPRPMTIDHVPVSSEGGAPMAPQPKAQFTVTNRQKVFWPEDGLTKGDLCDYYESIADTILPYLRDRPLALVRYPDGIHGKHFFQWNVPPATPGWVKTLALRADEDDKGDRTIERRGFLIDDPRSLLYLANLGCIPMHVLAWRAHRGDPKDQPGAADTPPDCDFFTVDFDVGRSTLAHGVEQALTLKRLLDDVGLPSFPKTSGQSGLHLLVPLGPGVSFDTAKMLCEVSGHYIVKEHPEHATMDRAVTRRGQRVFVDTGQTGRGRTIVCPYSVRAVLGATVSAPLAWDEVVPALDPKRFTLRTMRARIDERGDPMAGLLSAKPDVARAVQKLRERLG